MMELCNYSLSAMCMLIFCLARLRMDGCVLMYYKGYFLFFVEIKALIKYIMYAFWWKMSQYAIPHVRLQFLRSTPSVWLSFVLIFLRWNTPYKLSYHISWRTLKWGKCIVSCRMCVDYLWEFGNTYTTTFFRQKAYHSLGSGPAHCMNVNACMTNLRG